MVVTMPEESGRRAEKTRGRKRDTDRTDAILHAAAGLLLEVGFDKLRIQDVAERAGSGTGTIYRRWSTKEALLAEAIRNMPDPDPEVTDDPVADLTALVSDRCLSAANNPDLVPGLISAMRSDPGIEDAVKAGYSLEHVRSAIARIIGPEHPHLDVLTDMTQAIPLLRAAFASGTLDADTMTNDIVTVIQSVADTA
jgi:AcrR family transcriptional regulator